MRAEQRNRGTLAKPAYSSVPIKRAIMKIREQEPIPHWNRVQDARFAAAATLKATSRLHSLAVGYAVASWLAYLD